MFIPFRRASLLIPSGPIHDPQRKHLFIVLTDPFDDTGNGISRVLLVSISSLRDGCDRACILKPGDHPFIKHESFVVYRSARIEEAGKIVSAVHNNIFQAHHPVSEQVMLRICQGLETSKHTAPKILKFYKLSSPPIA